MTGPSGFGVEISTGEQSAWIAEVGAGLRRYTCAGREVLDGYGADEISHSGRGQVLLPWPNRIRDGVYDFAGARRQLSLTEPEHGNAIHGLVRWANWTVGERDERGVTMTCTLHPQPGYPHVLDLAVGYRLDEHGLTVTTTATNRGRDACPFGAGSHPYLAVDGPTVDSTVLQAPGATRLVSDDRGIPTGAEPVAGTDFDFREARPIGATVLDNAYTDLERDADGRARVRVGSTTLWLDENYRYVMLFTGDPLPDVARRSIAVEPMTCPPNAFQSGEGVLTLAPGESFSAAWGIEPSPS